MQPLVVINVAGLSPALLQREDGLPFINSLRKSGDYRAMQPVFPALTCPMQATLTTGVPPRTHGIVGNGWCDRQNLSVDFWSQSAHLLQAPRFWQQIKQDHPDFTVAVLCWQQIMGCEADMVLTPAPIHKNNGQMISSCYSKPSGLYSRLEEKHGPLELSWYWGPGACIRSSQWIGESARHILSVYRPSLTMVYLPHLDYALQKAGPLSPDILPELEAIDAVVAGIAEEAQNIGARTVVLSEYAIGSVTGAVCINRVLRDAGLLALREVEGREYLDIPASRAFAVVDHQIAHIYTQPDALGQTIALLEGTPGISRLLDADGQAQSGIQHPRSGELIAIADTDRWFAYYWWNDPDRAPHFATTVDIHNKPGYDPVELFFDPQNRCIPLDETLVKGSHGRLPEDDTNAAVLIVPEELPKSPAAGRFDARNVPKLLLELLQL